MPVQFEDKTVKYIVKNAVASYNGKKGDVEGATNPETWKLMKDGYVVLKNFIPKDVIEMTLDAWKVMELDPKMQEHLYLEQDIIQNSPEDTLFKSNGMHNSPFGVALHHWIWKNLKNKIDMNLQETYSYSRKYHRGAYLKAHADRPSCEISGTLCLDYHTDDNSPWSIWVDNTEDWINKPSEIYDSTQSITHRHRKGIKIDLEPGDLLMYQGPNVAHWRDKFLGEFGYHIFVHFINTDGRLIQMPRLEDIREQEMPPQIYKAADHFSSEYNPCAWDGRVSRYHPIDEETWERKLFTRFNEEVWADNKIWLHHDKGDFVNNYKNFKKIEK